jgi:uncharacterized protein (TIGR02145 family)
MTGDVIMHAVGTCHGMYLQSNNYGTAETRHPAGNGIDIYPNPSPGFFFAGIDAPAAGIAVVELYDMAGRLVFAGKEFLNSGYNTLRFDDIRGGIYILKIESGNHIGHAKVASQATSKGCPGIGGPASTSMDGNIAAQSGMRALKDLHAPVSKIVMQFNNGDTLKLTGISGNFRTVTMLFPSQSQTVTFTFVQCTDADSNHYAVVQIGTQLWMQENLKTTKYRDGTVIPNVTDSASWGSLSTGAWCDYHNLPEEGNYYGHLYNYYAVADNHIICPTGWHVPSHSEWNTMEKFLDPTVDTMALMGTGTLIGRILKEGCNTRWQYMDTTYGLNSAGFTALCTNFRNATGGWSLAPGNNHDDGFWTATSYSSSSAWYRSLRWCYSDIYTLFPMKRSGNSVRCVKDN